MLGGSKWNFGGSFITLKNLRKIFKKPWVEKRRILVGFQIHRKIKLKIAGRLVVRGISVVEHFFHLKLFNSKLDNFK